MAKIEIVREETEDTPRSVECVEVLVWGAGGTSSQEFCVGSGSNFNASTNFWLEIRYSVQNVPIFYTRNVVSHALGDVCSGQLDRLDKFEKDEMPGFGFGDMLPETSIILKRDKHSYQDGNSEEQTSISYSLKISADLGAIFGHSSPGERMLDIRLEYIDLDEALCFMRELIRDFEAACQGQHPDPGKLPPGFSDWPLAREINRQAYNRISESYQEDYFSNPLLVEAFDTWLGLLPAGGKVLDAGCGHGNPVIGRLLEKGFCVTGSDLSPAMLAQARNQYPNIEFWEKAITELEIGAAFEGACSFSSMLYLDQIDFFHGIHRLSQALKPGGLLFLYGYDLHPGWRGQPYDVDIHQWMWGGTRGMDEAVQALDEHGYFKVLKAQKVVNEQEYQEKVEQWRIQAQKEHDEWLQKLPPEMHMARTDYSNAKPPLAYPYFVIAQKQI